MKAGGKLADITYAMSGLYVRRARVQPRQRAGLRRRERLENPRALHKRQRISMLVLRSDVRGVSMRDPGISFGVPARVADGTPVVWDVSAGRGSVTRTCTYAAGPIMIAAANPRPYGSHRTRLRLDYLR